MRQLHRLIAPQRQYSIMGWLERTNRYIIYGLTIVLLGGSIAIIATGTIVQATLTFYNDFFDSIVYGPIISLIVAGILLFFVSFLGCCGVIKESYTMLLAMFVALLALVVMQITGSLLVTQNKADVGKSLRSAMDEQQELYVAGDWQAVQTWDALQSSFQCCGVETWEEWIVLNITVPPSCDCSGSNSANCDQMMDVYINGCKAVLADFISGAEHTLAINAMVFAVVEFFGAILVLFMARHIRSKQVRSSTTLLVF